MRSVGTAPGARLRVSGAITMRLGRAMRPTWIGSKRLGMGLLQAFELEGFLHCGALPHTLVVRLHVRHAGKVDVQGLRPPRDDEEVSIGHREVIAEQELASLEFAVDPAVACGELVAKDLLHLVGYRSVEERGVGLVDLRAD